VVTLEFADARRDGLTIQQQAGQAQPPVPVGLFHVDMKGVEFPGDDRQIGQGYDDLVIVERLEPGFRGHHGPLFFLVRCPRAVR
jgi:hypothetical protein